MFRESHFILLFWLEDLFVDFHHHHYHHHHSLCSFPSADDADKSCHWFNSLITAMICNGSHTPGFEDTVYSHSWHTSRERSHAYHCPFTHFWWWFDFIIMFMSCWWRDRDHDDPPNDSHSEAWMSLRCFPLTNFSLRVLTRVVQEHTHTWSWQTNGSKSMIQKAIQIKKEDQP